MLDDGAPAREIIARLEASTNPPLPYAITEKNFSDWLKTGYNHYLHHQERRADLQANREGAGGLIDSDDLTTLPEATLQIIANQYYQLFADFSADSLRQKLSEAPTYGGKLSVGRFSTNSKYIYVGPRSKPVWLRLHFLVNSK